MLDMRRGGCFCHLVLLLMFSMLMAGQGGRCERSEAPGGSAEVAIWGARSHRRNQRDQRRRLSCTRWSHRIRQRSWHCARRMWGAIDYIRLSKQVQLNG